MSWITDLKKRVVSKSDTGFGVGAVVIMVFTAIGLYTVVKYLFGKFGKAKRL